MSASLPTGLAPVFDTTDRLACFTGSRLGSDGSWAAHHFTSYTGAGPDAVPTDHGCLIRREKSYRIVITDGMGHWDPPGIGAVAAAVLADVRGLSIEDQIQRGRAHGEKGLSNESAYRAYLKTLARKYKAGEGTTLLQVEVCRASEKKVALTVGRCGDSDVVVLDETGAIQFSTVDIKQHLKPDGREIGLLAIGGNFEEEWLDHAPFQKTKIKVERVFVIACSDGLTEFFRNADGSIARSRFQYAALTGRAIPVGDSIPSLPSTRLTAAIIGRHLREAAMESARILQQNRDGRTIHAGDDTTIIVLCI